MCQVLQISRSGYYDWQNRAQCELWGALQICTVDGNPINEAE